MDILHTLWQKISGKQAQAASEPVVANAASTNPYRDNTAELFPDQYLPLWKLQSKRQLIEVKVDGSNRSYQTLILAIDVQRGIIWLDDLFPTQKLLEIGDEITLVHYKNGEKLSFTSPLVAWGRDYGATGLAILLPDQISYQPRRKHSRCDLTHASSIVVKVRPVGHDASYGTLQDLSVGGLRVRVAGNLLGQLSHGALMPVCELTLSDELHICCSARIRAFRLDKASHRCTHISLEFIDMSAEKQKQLQQFINNLQHFTNADHKPQEFMRQSA